MYTVESIIAELEANEDITWESNGKLGCPENCGRKDPDNCEKGKSQTCKQQVTVHYKYKKLGVLFFRYMISPKNHGGFIPRKDSILTHLIKRQLIIERNLKTPA